ncbi:uncharacterized protein LOC100705622 [Oreochromis niloticus]|uniref:uncharacterized protein LOC100705622 n=1 Tax=Oreochromis niloticus TaxID=8128 RepID=UPI000674CD1A|nr:uncharacterized protein LOC100705622 [Oreochromis niloticus]CAI5659786.1 unnamed protein product [Mustela putorius furo]
MSLSAVLLLLLHLTVCNSQNISLFFNKLDLGFVGAINFYTKEKYVNDSSSLTVRIMGNNQSCIPDFSFGCQENSCGYVSALVRTVDQEGNKEWCQNELRTVQPSSINMTGSLSIPGVDWVSGIKNNIGSWFTEVAFDLRNRSDTNKENSSPQSTVIPFVRVPSNCRRDFSPLMFDPDGDQVKCRYGNSSLFECSACEPPSVLSLSSSNCTLSFGPTADSNQGRYGVQLLMEDFPRKNITMTSADGNKTIKTPNDALSKVPIQFVLIVDPQVSSCTEGDFLPKFLPPTPANRARLYTPVNNTLEISISAEAKNSTISELLFSGPYDAIQNKTGTGTFTLKWTPSKSQDTDTLPFCFVVQALSKETKYHSDLRCVSVTVGNGAPASASGFVLVMGSFLSTLILAFPSI